MAAVSLRLRGAREPPAPGPPPATCQDACTAAQLGASPCDCVGGPARRLAAQEEGDDPFSSLLGSGEAPPDVRALAHEAAGALGAPAGLSAEERRAPARQRRRRALAATPDA